MPLREPSHHLHWRCTELLLLPRQPPAILSRKVGISSPSYLSLTSRQVTKVAIFAILQILCQKISLNSTAFIALEQVNCQSVHDSLGHCGCAFVLPEKPKAYVPPALRNQEMTSKPRYREAYEPASNLKQQQSQGKLYSHTLNVVMGI